MSTPLVQAVNLGGWLVVEGWIKPSLFGGIHHNDLLDGTCVRLKSVVDGRYLCADKGGGATVHAGSWDASVNETFRLWRINDSSFNFGVATGQFIGLDSCGEGKDVVAVAKTPGKTEEFEIQRNPDDLNRVRIKASNGFFLKEEDFKFISENGLNAVRIPVGWWTAHDPCPPKPYVGGSLKALDNAFC